MMADTRGRLILDDEGCLRVKGTSGYSDVVPVWPAEFEPEVVGEEVRVLNEEGRGAAKVGADIFLGGGSVGDSIKDGTGLSPRTARDLRERCQGTYWLAAPPARITER